MRLKRFSKNLPSGWLPCQKSPSTREHAGVPASQRAAVKFEQRAHVSLDSAQALGAVRVLQSRGRSSGGLSTPLQRRGSRTPQGQRRCLYRRISTCLWKTLGTTTNNKNLGLNREASRLGNSCRTISRSRPRVFSKRRRAWRSAGKSERAREVRGRRRGPAGLSARVGGRAGRSARASPRASA